MDRRPPIVSLLLFFEEFLFWKPGAISTIIERLLQLGFKSGGQGIDGAAWLTLVNPGLSALLFLTMIGPTVGWLHSELGRVTSTDLSILLSRHSIIRIIPAGLIVYWILKQVMAALSGDVGSLMDLYRDKSFWSMLFAGIAAYRFVSPSNFG